jgi:hypothetical protein
MNSTAAVPIVRPETVASILILMGLVLILGLIWDMFRRGSDFPSLFHGRAEIPGRWVRWLWVLSLILSFFGGGRAVIYSYSEVNGLRQAEPVAIDSPIFEDRVNVAGTSRKTSNFLFYESERSSIEYRDGRTRSAANHRFVIPWVFFLLVMAYGWAVLRYHGPGGQLQQRVLEDKPWPQRG